MILFYWHSLESEASPPRRLNAKYFHISASGSEPTYIVVATGRFFYIVTGVDFLMQQVRNSSSGIVEPYIRPTHRPTAYVVQLRMLPGLRASFYPKAFQIFHMLPACHNVMRIIIHLRIRVCVAPYSRNHGSVRRRCPSSSKREGK